MTEHFSVKKEHEEAEVTRAKPKDKASPTGLPHPPYFMQPPRLSIFSGEKKDADYDVWKYEVLCLQKEGTYSADAILHAVRRSMKGEAVRVLMNCGSTASLDAMSPRKML